MHDPVGWAGSLGVGWRLPHLFPSRFVGGPNNIYMYMNVVYFCAKRFRYGLHPNGVSPFSGPIWFKMVTSE